MKIDQCYQLGHVAKAHGLKGELMIFLDVDFPEDYAEMESIFLDEKGELIPFFIESISLQSAQKAIVSLEEVKSREQAEQLTGKVIYLPLSELEELDSTQFYFHEIIGFEVIDHSGPIGAVESIAESGKQNLLVVRSPEGDEILIPISDEILNSVDRTDKKVLTKLPEGLLEIYKSPS